jgi:uncharacterized protein (DUF1330 family)
MQKNTFRLLRNRSKITVASISPQGPGTQVTGSLPQGPVVILRWDSMEALQAWRNSPEFQAALKIGEKYATFNIVAVNGMK